MKITYRGYEIEAHREKCMAGYSLLYYSIFRESDGFECTSGFQDSSETVPDMINLLKGRVDAELLDPDPWGEEGPL